MNSRSARQCSHARSGFAVGSSIRPASNRRETPAGSQKRKERGKGETKELALCVSSPSRDLATSRGFPRSLLHRRASRGTPKNADLDISTSTTLMTQTSRMRRSLKLSRTARPRDISFRRARAVNQLYPKISFSLPPFLSLFLCASRRSPADLHNQELIKRRDHTSVLILSRANRSKRAKSGRGSRRDPQNRARHELMPRRGRKRREKCISVHRVSPRFRRALPRAQSIEREFQSARFHPLSGTNERANEQTVNSIFRNVLVASAPLTSFKELGFVSLLGFSPFRSSIARSTGRQEKVTCPSSSFACH